MYGKIAFELVFFKLSFHLLRSFQHIVPTVISFQCLTLSRLHLSIIFRSVKNDFDSMVMKVSASDNTKFSIFSRKKLLKISEVAISFLQSWKTLEIVVHWSKQCIVASRILTFMMVLHMLHLIWCAWSNLLEIILKKTPRLCVVFTICTIEQHLVTFV